MKTKTCSTCGEAKSLDSYYKDKRSSDGLVFQCKKCYDIRIKKHNSKPSSIEKRREYQRKRSKTPKAKKYSAKYHRKWREERSLHNDAYISRLITHKSPELEKKDITKEMLELKRKHLKMCRTLRKIKERK
jgi:hypothetical protein